MRRRRAWALVTLAAALVVAAAGFALSMGRTPDLASAVPARRPPRLAPDYCGVMIPPNIAPLNFRVDEPGARYHVRIRSARGEPIEILSRTGCIRMPLKRWRALLSANAGEELRIEVHVRSSRGSWRRFEDVSNRIAREPIDRYLIYRQFNVIYVAYVHMRIVQRSLEDFERTNVLDNGDFGHGCVGCHTCWNNGPERAAIQLRSGAEDYGHGMVLMVDGRVSKVSTRTERTPRLAAFSSWHPSGEVLAFSINKIRQFFHSARTEIRDGVDLDSDLAVYVVDSGMVTSTPSIADPDRLETWPAWSADGRHLYYSSSPVPWTDRDTVPPQGYTHAMYDLMRIGYDVGSGTWGESETVLSAAEVDRSITLPRPSPDGRFLVCCMSEYSMYPIWQPSSDLHLLNLATGEWRRLECNSDRSESWHSWSSNGRWLAFGSKRADGLFHKIYFAHIDESGRSSKPFLLPEEDPTFYDSFFKVRQLPELIDRPLAITGEALARIIRSAPWEEGQLPATGATP